MTWAEFKKAIEAAGIRDDDELAFVDVGMDANGVAASKDECGDWKITDRW
jgi:hypothetical protein